MGHGHVGGRSATLRAGPMATRHRSLIIAPAAVALAMANFVAVSEASSAVDAPRSDRDRATVFDIARPGASSSFSLEVRPSEQPKPTHGPKPTATPTPRPKPATTPTPARSTPKPTPGPTATPAINTPTPTWSPQADALLGPVTGTTPGAGITAASGVGPISGLPVAPFPVLLAVVAMFAVIAGIRRRRRATVEGAVALAVDPPDDPPTLAVAPRPLPVGEEHVPRWRRPSVVAARFDTDNTVTMRAATAGSVAPRRAPNVFTDLTADAGDRMRLRYDGVPLLDQPDDALGRSQADLDTGDEVLILDRDEVWANVTTPAGTTGWVPTMVLADASGWVVEDVVADPGLQGESPGPGLTDDDQPSLEVLLERIAAERRARQEAIQASEPPARTRKAPAPRRKAAKAPSKPTLGRGPGTGPAVSPG
jgi:hypothetical protein